MDTQKKTHIERNISKIRELCGMKKEALALAMGVCQQTISTMENNEKVDRNRLDEVYEQYLEFQYTGQTVGFLYGE